MQGSDILNKELDHDKFINVKAMMRALGMRGNHQNAHWRIGRAPPHYESDIAKWKIAPQTFLDFIQPIIDRGIPDTIWDPIRRLKFTLTAKDEVLDTDDFKKNMKLFALISALAFTA